MRPLIHIFGSRNTIFALLLGLLWLPLPLQAAESTAAMLDLTGHWVGFVALAIFFVAYALVILEEELHMRKSKPVIVAAGLIWALIAVVYAQQTDPVFHDTAAIMIRHNLLEYAELFLFLLAAMTFINTMGERGVFDAIRGWLVNQGFTLRSVFWLTGLMAFFISPVADNLTTALLMATVVMTVAAGNHKFIAIACINIVVAANAGGAFSPFGDITTLMVWQKGVLDFTEFFALFVPSLVNWLIPAVLMSLAIRNVAAVNVQETVELKPGALVVIGLFIVTIGMAAGGHHYLHLPPVMGMMTGLGLLKLYGYVLKLRDTRLLSKQETDGETPFNLKDETQSRAPFNIFKQLQQAEWDTLMFFYGIILCVGGLGTIGYLSVGSQMLYGDLGATNANILVGLISAVIDNIPVMFAVLSMMPEMSQGQWLLVTLTAGVGGSLLSIGSAAGVAVMGQARGIYTFFAHLKWIWAIALGYAASIWMHLWFNASLFNGVPIH